MNKKVVKYCASTLKKMVDYHLKYDELDDNELLDINNDLKTLLKINTVNIYRIKQHEDDKVFSRALRDLFCQKYLKNDVVKQWLILFINNAHIDFDEILEAADKFNSNTLEIQIRVKDCIDLNETRRNQIINLVLMNVRKETKNKKEYDFFIINLQESDEICKAFIFKKSDVLEIERSSMESTQVSRNELLNTIFDYFIINKPKETL